MTTIHRCSNSEGLAKAAAEFIVSRAREAQAEGGDFSLALSGGSTPKETYRTLADSVTSDGLDWRRVRVFWGDERCVPPDDAASNFRMARETLLDHVPVPEGQVFRMACEGDPEQGARDYEAILRRQFGDGDLPRFDVVLLGLGPDGHTASLFPGTSALESHGHWAMANYVEKMGVWRMTLSLEVINAAAVVAFLVQGEEKAQVLRAVVEDKPQGAAYPAGLIQPHDGELHWFVDEAAASLLQDTP